MQSIEKKNRIDFWIGIGCATWTTAVIGTFIGFYASDYLDKNIMMGLAILNPIYFLCMMVGAMKTIQIGASVILGLLLGPIFYFFSEVFQSNFITDLSSFVSSKLKKV